MRSDFYDDIRKGDCQRVEYIYVTDQNGREERLEHGISYSLCLEAERRGVSLKDLLSQRINPNLKSYKVRYWI